MHKNVHSNTIYIRKKTEKSRLQKNGLVNYGTLQQWNSIRQWERTITTENKMHASREPLNKRSQKQCTLYEPIYIKFINTQR